MLTWYSKPSADRQWGVLLKGEDTKNLKYLSQGADGGQDQPTHTLFKTPVPVKVLRNKWQEEGACGGLTGIGESERAKLTYQQLQNRV